MDVSALTKNLHSEHALGMAAMSLGEECIKKDRDFYFDELGNEIHEGDLLKIYHFIGARRRKHFMYQIAIRQESNDGLWWAAKDYHRTENKGHYWLLAVANKETGVIPGYRVIARKNYEEKNFKIR